jgi:hypothetical protein
LHQTEFKCTCHILWSIDPFFLTAGIHVLKELLDNFDILNEGQLGESTIITEVLISDDSNLKDTVPLIFISLNDLVNHLFNSITSPFNPILHRTSAVDHHHKLENGVVDQYVDTCLLKGDKVVAHFPQ